METIKSIWFENERIYALTSKDEVYSRPLEAFPLLKEATDKERENYTLELRGEAVRWKDLDEDIHISSFFETSEPNYDNEIGRIFKKFPQLDTSEIARNIGIHKSLLSKYIYGMKKPSEERINQITALLHSLGKELAVV